MTSPPVCPEASAHQPSRIWVTRGVHVVPDAAFAAFLADVRKDRYDLQ